jgi:hypothetical protein
MEKKMVASIMKYRGDKEKALAWLSKLPVTYPEYVLDNIYIGDFLLWSKDYGFEILEGK